MRRVIICLFVLGLAGCGDRDVTWGDAGRAVLGVTLTASCMALTAGNPTPSCINLIQ